ncbi:elongation factor 1- [Stylonychia lemnae]|uniref:Elongation factor 1 n=1 Tax=Stylonychia lemnae TaxID=5949 RepID=A0A078AQU9_STYLE|nr:elongation factor 1- [Stylonychia lemnae]|eukprot:CDW83612.1 elongation factor 1- [Stylonychia lemnae]
MSQKSGRSISKIPDETEEEHYSSEQLDSQQEVDSESHKSEDSLSEQSKSEDSFESKSSESIEENTNQDQSDQEQDEDDQIDENDELDQHSQSQQNDDYECDEEGRPKGVSKLFNLIKEDLGETQSESFKLFYDLMSNQIKYCLQNYIENDDEDEGQEQNTSQNQLEESKLEKKKDNNSKPIISPIVLANLLQQQKSLILNVVDQQKDRLINESKQQKNQLIQQSQDTLSFKNIQASSSHQVVEERKIKLKLKPRNQQTKQHMINKNKNHLIMINTMNTKELKVILEYLADKQCELPINKVLLRTSSRKFTVEQQNLKIQELIKNEKPIEQKESEPAVYQIMYDIIDNTKGKNVGQKRFFKENQISLINTKQDGKRGFQDLSKMSALSDDEDEDLNDEDLISMFTEVFSIILLNKRKKFLKLKHLDKDARLPHPSSLLSKSKKNNSEYESRSKRREVKQQMKSENEKAFQTKDNRLSEQISFGMNSSKGGYNLPFTQEKQVNNPEDSQFELFETNPYFHQLMKQRNINQQQNQADISTLLVKVTGKLLNLSFNEIQIPAPEPQASGKEKEPKTNAGDKLRAKSQTGKFPILETPEGFTIFEGLTIAKYLARQRPSFYGDSNLQTALIDQWVDYVSSSIAPQSQQIQNQVFGLVDADPKSFSLELNSFKKNLQVFESHLKLRNFLVGYQMTLADVALVANLIVPLQTVLDATFRKESIPNLSRYCSIILENPTFVSVFGRVHFSKKPINPKFDFSKQQEKKPQPQKQEKPKEEKPKIEAKDEKKEKEPSWEDKLPQSTFDLFNYKTLIVNAEDKREALQQLWSQWDDNAFSIWFIHYQKYDGEGVQLHVTNNLMNGFMQRIDDKLRKHALGVIGVYGEEPSLEIMGVLMWRGTGIPLPMEEHPQFEYYNKRRLDIQGSDADKKLVESFWVSKEEGTLEVDGKQLKVQTKKLYK